MKVNYIDEKGDNVIKDIDVNFENMSVSDMTKVFKGCSSIANIPEMDLLNVLKEDIVKAWQEEVVSGSQICPNCGKEHDSDEWNGYCSKKCWWGLFTNRATLKR